MPTSPIPPLTDAELAALEEAARAVEVPLAPRLLGSDWSLRYYGSATERQVLATRDYVVAAGPSVVLALLAEVRAARADRELRRIAELESMLEPRS
jgi:hypothetical protein